MCDCCLLHHYQRLEMLYLITYYYFMIRQHRRRRKRWRHTDEVGKKRNETHTQSSTATNIQSHNLWFSSFSSLHHVKIRVIYIYSELFSSDSKSSFSSFRIIIISNHILFPLSLSFSLSSLFSIKLYIYLLL